ncbi:MAG: phosphoglycerate dehydrogenase [Candidatus Bathyarchaeia archaeon]
MVRVFVASRSFGRVVPDGVRLLQDVGDLVWNPFGRALTSMELQGFLRDVDAALLGNDVCDRAVFESAERLRVVSRHGIGVDAVDLEAATDHGIVVTNTPHVNAVAVAEHALALMLALLRRVPAADASVKAGRWEGLKFMGGELYGRTLGIVGLGAIGVEVARRAKSLGMNVLYVKRRRNLDLERELGLTFKPLTELLSESDIVSIHLPLTDETKGLIGEEEIASMKPGAYIVNTARGGILNLNALVEALKSGRLAGAALDVYDSEPPDFNHPLFKLENVILTPHIGAYTVEAVRRMDTLAAENIVKALKGQIPEHVVNKEVLSRGNLRIKAST